MTKPFFGPIRVIVYLFALLLLLAGAQVLALAVIAGYEVLRLGRRVTADQPVAQLLDTPAAGGHAPTAYDPENS